MLPTTFAVILRRSFWSVLYKWIMCFPLSFFVNTSRNNQRVVIPNKQKHSEINRNLHDRNSKICMWKKGFCSKVTIFVRTGESLYINCCALYSGVETTATPRLFFTRWIHAFACVRCHSWLGKRVFFPFQQKFSIEWIEVCRLLCSWLGHISGNPHFTFVNKALSLVFCNFELSWKLNSHSKFLGDFKEI